LDLSPAKERILQVCEQVKLNHFLDRQLEGFDSRVGERGLRLSGGEKQRVGIARCLLKDADIIVFDEATSALDSITEQEIQASMDMVSNKTMLVVAHRLSTIRNADLILVLEMGNIIEQGTHQELIDIKGKY